MKPDQPCIDSIFLAAAEMPSREERSAYLDQACRGESELRKRIERLLGAQSKVGSFLEAPAPELNPTLAPHSFEQAGTVIGRYKLLEQVGEGGMGVVYVAEQTEPVRRRVALKIIKPGMDTKQVIARFEAERQALAMMDHPNIAKVLDAGTTEAGRPYFVMELVRGMPITEYCDKVRLSPRQRLELFVDVCHATQHAHQKGIIHRDLKPSNVLITLHDGTPVVKVIDFGVAKAVGQQLTEHTVYTALTQLVGTPLYMSPEQAEMSGLDVDTRSDVYSLGVLLYELLTGQTPFDKETLAKAGLDEMRRIIREDEPLRPSRRFSTLGAAAISTASQHRGVDERRLSKILCGELDWIVMKALEKDRSRRYESASSLAADIQRYLSDEPVLACPPTTMYRFQKFARKHKPALATAAAIAACLVLGTTVSAWQAARATTAEAQANANANKAQENAQQANTQRDEAQKQRDEVRALNEQLQAAQAEQRSTLYAAHMILAQRAWDSSDLLRVRELLDQQRPKPGVADLRSFEWHYLQRLCHSELLTLSGHARAVSSVAYSPDGKRLASAAGGKFNTTKQASVGGAVKVWDAQSGRQLMTIEVYDGRSVVFSPDGKRLATDGDDNSVKLWDAQTGQELQTFKGHTKWIAAVAFSHDGKRLASASNDNTVKLWDAQTGQEVLSLKGAGWGVSFSPDGKRLATAGGSGVKLWDAETGQLVRSVQDKNADSVTFSPDGKRLASSSWQGTLRLWDVDTGKEIRTFNGAFRMAAFSPDGNSLASPSDDETVKVWDVNKDQAMLTVKTDSGNSVAFSPDWRRLASAASDNSVKIRDAQTGREILSLKGHDIPVRLVAFSPDGTRLASGAGGHGPDFGVSRKDQAEVKVWDTQTGKELLTLPMSSGSVWAILFSPDGTRLAASSHAPAYSDTAVLKIWDVQTGRELLFLKGQTGPIHSLAFSPDGKRLVYGSNGCKVLDAESGQELLTLTGSGGGIASVAFSPDGKRLLASSRQGSVKVWDALTGQETLTLREHMLGGVSSVALSPDGKRIATLGANTRLKLWDSQNGNELLSLEGKSGLYRTVVFSPDGHRLAAGGSNGTEIIYDATPLPEKP